MMHKEPPLVECVFGWGQVFRLYQHYLDVDGTRYDLTTLTHIRHAYHRVLGVASARIELRFGRKKVMLRGIAAVEDAGRAIAHLTSYYLGFQQTAFDRFNKSDGEAGTGWRRDKGSEFSITPPPSTQVELEEYSPITAQDVLLKERSQAPTEKVETPGPGWQRFLQEQRTRRQQRLQVERSLREHGFDVAKLAQRLKEETLPEVAVPTRLLAGERAHYSTDATLCGEPVSGTMRYTYPVKDHGTLILTSRRLIYIGRRSQVVLAYAGLLHVSRLRGALAFQAEQWSRREIFEIPRPLECTMYLDRILEYFQEEQQLQAMAGSYRNDIEQHEEGTVTGDIDTIPLSLHAWEMMEVLDRR